MEQSRIDQAIKRLEERWSDQGDCGSCGWHGGLNSDYSIDDWELEWALENNEGYLELPCVSHNENNHNHRGVKIFIGEEE